ncbi:hypothetical protein BIW11_12191 [Tropilaelaps mercedesae]|uniref:Uncharacterized protein n=1 Tax=Tropilaelaps mercedesae TaxID=418985 RepID=A0A1V9X7I8_9ACAR|nr:hypothetical protein BIW11_12191 [Tropilaelaps mercedesae]
MLSGTRSAIGWKSAGNRTKGRAIRSTPTENAPTVMSIMTPTIMSIMTPTLADNVDSELGPDELAGASSTTTTDDPRTPKDVLAIKKWSMRPDKSEPVGTSHEQHRTNIVPPRKIDLSRETVMNGDNSPDHFGDKSRKGDEVPPNADNGEDGADRHRHIFVNPKFKTTTASSTTTGTTDAPATPTQPPPDDTQNEMHTSTSLVDRLLDFDLNSKHDMSLLLVFLCAALVALVLLVLLLWGVRRGCREKIPIRENPLYTGAPARRINNVSFRPSSRHKRAMQERTYT